MRLLCPSSGVFYCTFGTGKFQLAIWYIKVCRDKQLTPNYISIKINDISNFTHILNFSMKLTSAECTVENS